MALLGELSNTLQMGQLLMVETRSEILIGTLKLFDPNCKIIELTNVRDFNTNFVYTSAQILPLPQIKSIKIIENTEYSDEISTTKSSISSTECSETSSTTSASPSNNQKKPTAKISPQNVSTVSPACSSVNLSNRELQLIQDQLNNVTYIFQTDQLYHKAIADIKTQSVVSLLLEPMQFGRHNRTSLLVVGTNRVVYIFDIVSLGKIFREFKEILESKRPRKIMHFSHRIVDNLKHRQDLVLAGVFDTFVAHCLLAGTKTHLSLLETVQHYFNISEIYFADQYQQEPTNLVEPFDAFKRPIAKRHLQLLAKQVIFQYKLYEHLLHEQMLANFYEQCENFSISLSNNLDSVDVVMQMKANSRQGFEHIRPKQGWNELLQKQL